MQALRGLLLFLYMSNNLLSTCFLRNIKCSFEENHEPGWE